MDLTRQHQKYTDRFGPPVGDCWRTAVACLLGVERDSVPHFAEKEATWWPDTIAFVEAMKPGWTLICVNAIFPVYNVPEVAPKEIILSGDSPRGPWYHACLASAITGELLWDPFPGGTGVGLSPEMFALTLKKDVNIQITLNYLEEYV